MKPGSDLHILFKPLHQKLAQTYAENSGQGIYLLRGLCTARSQYNLASDRVAGRHCSFSLGPGIVHGRPGGTRTR